MLKSLRYHRRHFVNLSRIWQHLGFGIQSPNDYSFLHDVIRERLPYYAYDDIRVSHSGASEREIRMQQLVFRVRNAFHGENIAVLHEDETLPHFHNVRAVVILPRIVQTSIFNLRNTLQDSLLWQEILRHKHAVTFDMVDVGIAIFNAERYAEHYKIMPL